MLGLLQTISRGRSKRMTQEDCWNCSATGEGDADGVRCRECGGRGYFIKEEG